MQNISFLACLEVVEKFVVVVGWWWLRPSLGFSFSQAEQNWGPSVSFTVYLGFHIIIVLITLFRFKSENPTATVADFKAWKLDQMATRRAKKA